MRNACQLASFIYLFIVSYQKQQVSFHASKRKECSQTVHYLGFLDMSSHTAWPHSLEKKNKV